ncbi:ATP-binding protein [Kitasatospora sp. RB6PN24]|uniref:ATP-binding protein n=1 Tax=Kitasatospora humi TaxID=2893891 RepID=UPI001E395522|nr:ATP-binding protein [Kitasatospora humi]MCC9307576.1 ATP-binding protein [Kitasatospora humi]
MPETLRHPSAPAAAHRLPRHRRSAGAARRLLRDFLAQQESGERYVEVGELLLSELVANAVQHARVPADRLIAVQFALADDELRIEVHDADGTHHPDAHPDAHPDSVPTAEPPDWQQESGRGLFLVHQLSARWGCDPRPGGIGKTIWCTVLPAPTGSA